MGQETVARRDVKSERKVIPQGLTSTNPRKRRMVIYSALRGAPVPKANQLVVGLLASRTSSFTWVMPDLTICSRSAAASDKSMIRP